MKKKIENVVLDQEWITLIKEAKKLGLSLDEVRQFLNHIRERSKV
ncbi:anti-repressor SinI family protein [Oceanobacillus sojae]|nr:anti-repressor SinI family protein [Oceanobacillus sojae]MCT1904344.1 anti-repressor SinI family protein [Oceanobacillus sojae]